MKLITFFAIMLFSSLGMATEKSTGNICMHIPERGAETVIIEHNCKKGDIIQINKLNIPRLCDFNSAIVSFDGHDQYVCAYLGEQRQIRDGTN